MKSIPIENKCFNKIHMASPRLRFSPAYKTSRYLYVTSGNLTDFDIPTYVFTQPNLVNMYSSSFDILNGQSS